jgi:hypothetical protein
MKLSDDGKILLNVDNSDIRKDGSFYIPKGVTSIGVGAFLQCSGLKAAFLPEGLTSIEAGAFSECTGLQTLVLPEGLTSIGNSVFFGCIKLKTLDIPEGVTIGGSAFFGWSGLQTFVLPKGLTSIGFGTFNVCTGLQILVLHEGLTAIAPNAFQSCINMHTVVIASTNEAEIQRITQLLPNALKNIVISMDTAKNAYQIQDAQFSRILSIPQINPLYLLLNQGLLFDNIQIDLFALMNCYLKCLPSSCQQAKSRMLEVPFPKTQSETEDYEIQLRKITDQIIQTVHQEFSNNIGQLDDSCSFQTTGKDVLFFQTSGNQTLEEQTKIEVARKP